MRGSTTSAAASASADAASMLTRQASSRSTSKSSSRSSSTISIGGKARGLEKRSTSGGGFISTCEYLASKVSMFSMVFSSVVNKMVSAPFHASLAMPGALCTSPWNTQTPSRTSLISLTPRCEWILLLL